MTLAQALRTLLRPIVAATALVLAGPALADCAVSSPAVDLGSQSPNAVKAGAIPYTPVDGGFSCTSSSLVSLLANNYLRATVASNASLLLTAPSGATIAYTLAGMADGSAPLRPGQATDYVGGNGLTILSIGGTGPMTARVHVKPSSTTLPTPGVYSGTVDVRWDWRFCTGVYALGLCTLGEYNAGSGTSRIAITLTVAPRPIGVQITTETTWDTVSGTSSPKALPGSKQRVSVTVTNSDIVALDLDTLAIVLPTVAKTAVALDGDGRNGGAAVKSAQGSPASGLTLTYAGPADPGDDVDFSSATTGNGWSYTPVAGDSVTQGAVQRVRLRPRGVMAAGSSFTMSLPYSVK